MANATLITYDDVSRREDLLDTIHIISPKDRPFLTGADHGVANGTYHEFEIDVLAARAHNAAVEDADPTFSALDTPTRTGNISQILEKPFRISSTSAWVRHAGIQDVEAYYKGKKRDELLNDLELALLRGSIASGTGSAARQMRGMLNAVTTNATAVASGTAWSETLLSGLRQLTWSQGIGQGVECDLYVGAFIKRKTSQFSVNTTEIEAVGRRVIRDITRYEGDFGVVNVLLCRDMLTGTNALSVLLTEPTPLRVAYGEGPKMKKLAETGRNMPRLLWVEATLEEGNEKAHAKITGLSDTL